MTARHKPKPPHLGARPKRAAAVPAANEDVPLAAPGTPESAPAYEWLAAYDQLAEPIFIHDRQFRILRCNAAYAARAGRPMEEIVGKPYWQVFPKLSGPTGNCVEALDKESVSTLSEFTTESGEVFLTHDITAHRASGEFWYSQHLLENITARTRANEVEKLRTSFSDAIIGSAPGVFVVVDHQGRVVRWNGGLNALTGRSDAELLGAPLISLVPQEDRQQTVAMLEEVLVTGSMQGDIRLEKHTLGAWNYVFSARHFQVGGVPYVACFCIDKSEVKQLEQDLIREKTISDTIIESAPGAFFMIDQQGNLLRWNKYLSKETGLSDEQLRSASILSTIHEEDRPLAAAKFLAAFATGYAEMEVRVPTPDNGVRLFFKTARRFVADGVPYVAGFCIDVTDRQRAVDDLAKEKAFADALIESAPGAFYVVDMQGNYYRWNSYLNRLTGLSDRQLQHRTSLLTIHEEDRPLAAAVMKDAFENGYAQAELRVLTCERGVRLYLMTARRFQVGEAAYLVGVGVDTTDRLIRVKELEHEARTDPLTQIANRGHFLEMGRHEFARCRRYGRALSLWMLDIDHFKAVNDTYGHHAGDIALQSLVTISRQTLRDWDIMGRMGGEEFAVLLPETDTHQALLVAERLRQTVAATGLPLRQGEPVRLTVSIGIATARDDDGTLEDLLARADQALYDAKQTGRDKVCLAEHLEPG